MTDTKDTLDANTYVNDLSFYVNIPYSADSFNHTCDCHGIVTEDAVYDIFCYDEEFDTIWDKGNLDTEQPFRNWKEVVLYFTTNYNSRIEQITVLKERTEAHA